MPDPTPPTEAERLREELLDETVCFPGNGHCECASCVAILAKLDALLAAVRREEREPGATDDDEEPSLTFRVIGANDRGSIVECLHCHRTLDGADLGLHSCAAAAIRASQEGENG